MGSRAVHDAGVIARLSRLADEVAIDLAALDARAAEVAEIGAAFVEPSAMPRDKVLVLAVNLHGYYTALETLLERIARLLDESVPAGPKWHVDLVSQMQTELPGLRPAVLPRALSVDLHELRKFRHFFRNAYVLDLDPARTRVHGDRLIRLNAEVGPAIRAHLDHLRAVVAELTRG